MRKAKALLVEDNDLARMVAKMTLEKENCEVDEAATEEEAVSLAQSKKYDIIFMDIGLGDTDGFIVTEQIRKNSELNAHTPIVALTAHTEDSYRQKAKQVGMDDYLTKPIEMAQLKNIIHKWVSVTPPNLGAR